MAGVVRSTSEEEEPQLQVNHRIEMSTAPPATEPLRI